MKIQLIIVTLLSAFSLLGFNKQARDPKHEETFKEIEKLQSSQRKCYEHCVLMFTEPDMAGIIGPCIMRCDQEIGKDLDRQKERLKDMQKN